MRGAEAHGVTCAVRSTNGAATGSIVVIAERTERSMLTDRGANLLLAPADIDSALNFDAQTRVHLHLSGYPLLDAASHPAAVHALARASARGLTTSVDAASAGPLRRSPGFLDWVRGVDVLFANADEARALVGTSDDPVLLAVALAQHVGLAVVKLGSLGALACWGRNVVSAPAATARVVDPTGAGDAFAAGFLSAWLSSGSIEESLVAGAALGAQAVASVGARPIRPGQRRSSSAVPKV